MKRTIVLITLLFALVPAFGQTKNTSTKNYFTPSQLKQDFTLTRQLFETMHPALYDYMSKDHLDHLFDSTAKLLNRDMTALDFFSLLSPIISGLGCGHTAVGLPTKESDYITR